MLCTYGAAEDRVLGIPGEFLAGAVSARDLVSDTWLEMRAKSRVKRVVVIGRRGPLNVSFTIKELREMIKLPAVQSVINPSDFEGVKEQLKSLERPRKAD